MSKNNLEQEAEKVLIIIEKIKEVQELPEEVVKEFLEAKGKLNAG